VWAGVEALWWWEKKQPLPANLVTTGLASDTRPGALGQPNTVVVFGPGGVSYGAFSGLRAFAGVWLDAHRILGLDVSGFVLEDRGSAFGISSTPGGNPLLAVRHLDVPTGTPDAFLIATPGNGGSVGPFAGGVAVRTESQLWGIDQNVLHAFCWSPCFHLVGLTGFRYLDLNDSVTILTRKNALGSSAALFLGNSYPAPALELTSDHFRGRNQFFGGQMGLQAEWFFNRFFLGLTGKLALGQTDEVTNVLGISTMQPQNARPLTASGGLFALPGNSGRFRNRDFGVVPEVQVQGGVQLAPWCRVTIGYDFLYWSRVLRPGEQIDLTVDSRQVPTDPAFKAGTTAGPPRPLANRTDFWAQGLTLGLAFSY
jgi:hypothetical protein